MIHGKILDHKPCRDYYIDDCSDSGEMITFRFSQDIIVPLWKELIPASNEENSHACKSIFDALIL